jgi:hypothetical protein
VFYTGLDSFHLVSFFHSFFLLSQGDVNRISSALGLIVVAMTITFGIGASGISVNPSDVLVGIRTVDPSIDRLVA